MTRLAQVEPSLNGIVAGKATGPSICHNHGMAAKPARAIALVRSPTTDGIGVFRITVGAKAQFYTFKEIPCDIGGRGFVVHRLGLGTVYHVRVGVPADSSCECLGWLRHDHCKHVLGLKALIARALV